MYSTLDSADHSLEYMEHRILEKKTAKNQNTYENHKK